MDNTDTSSALEKKWGEALTEDELEQLVADIDPGISLLQSHAELHYAEPRNAELRNAELCSAELRSVEFRRVELHSTELLNEEIVPKQKQYKENYRYDALRSLAFDNVGITNDYSYQAYLHNQQLEKYQREVQEYEQAKVDYEAKLYAAKMAEYNHKLELYHAAKQQVIAQLQVNASANILPVQTQTQIQADYEKYILAQAEYEKKLAIYNEKKAKLG